MSFDLKPCVIAAVILHPGLVQICITNFASGDIMLEKLLKLLLAQIDGLML